MNILPEGWKYMQLGDLVSLVSGESSAQLSPSAVFSLLSLDRIGPFTGPILAADTHSTRLRDLPANHVSFRPGDLLCPRSFGRLAAGHVAIAEELIGDVGFISREYFVLRPGELIRPAWLMHFMRVSPMARHLRSTARIADSAGTPRLSTDALLALMIPVPPLPDQDRLTRMLNEALALCRVRIQADALRGDVLASAFAALAGNPAGLWEMDARPLGAIAVLYPGANPSRSVSHHYGGGVPWVRSQELQDQDIYTTSQSLSPSGVAAASAITAPSGTILMGLVGESIGRTGLLQIESTFSQRVAGILSRDPQYPNDFLWAWLQVAQRQIRSLTTGSVRPSLSLQRLWRLTVPTVPVSVRFQIAAIVRELQGLNLAAGKQAADLSSLYRGLVDKTYAGILPEGETLVAGISPTLQSAPTFVRTAIRSQERVVISNFSPQQLRIWTACRETTGIFSVDLLEKGLGAKDPIAREDLHGALSLFVMLGLLIKDGRPYIDLWRLPNPDYDREVVL